MQTCLQSVCNLFGWHPKPLSYLLSLGLVQVPGSAATEAAAAGRAGGRRRWWEPGRAAAGLCGAPGGPGDRGRHAGGPSPRPVADRPPPRSRAARTLTHSCAQRLRDSALPRRAGPPSGCTRGGGGVQASPRDPPPPAPAPRTGVRLGKVGEVPDAARAPPRPSPRPAPRARRPGCAGPRHRWGQAPRLPPRLPYLPEMLGRLQRLAAAAKAFRLCLSRGAFPPRSTSPGVEEARNGRERQEGDALPRLLTFAWDFHRPTDLSGQNLS